MNNVQVIYTQEIIGRTFKIWGKRDNPLFLAKDVASWIEHSDVSTMVRSVDDNEKLIQTMFVAGQNREVTFLTEDGLFEVLMLSQKPIAKQFKTKVKEVLRSIRKNGMYAKDELLDNPDLLLDVVTKLKVERDARLKIEKQLQVQAPKVEAYETLMDSKQALYIREVAKLLNSKEWGEKRLFAFLRNAGVLMGNNEPYQRYVDKGCFRVIARIYQVHDETRTTKTTLVTSRGVDYILKLIKA